MEHGIEWKKCVGICTDSATNMTEHLSLISAKVKNFHHPDPLSTHCIMDREQHMAKRKFPVLHELL